MSNLPEDDYLYRDDDYGTDIIESESEGTTTGKFFFPTGDLPKDDYYLTLAFYVSSETSLAYAWDADAEVELGPHLISVEKIKTEDEVCDVTVIDDDYAADDIFWG